VLIMDKNIIALIINIGLLIWSSVIFLNKGIPAGIYNWKFYASLIGVLIFFAFISVILIKALKGIKSP